MQPRVVNAFTISIIQIENVAPRDPVYVLYAFISIIQIENVVSGDHVYVLYAFISIIEIEMSRLATRRRPKLCYLRSNLYFHS